jgi:hypothetical protein
MEDNKFKCNICKFSCKYKSYLDRHKKSKTHYNNFNICYLCFTQLEDKIKLNDHIKNKICSNNSIQFTCKKCNSLYNDLNHFLDHLNSKISCIKLEFNCSYCNNIFNDIKLFETHIFDHGKQQSFSNIINNSNNTIINININPNLYKNPYNVYLKTLKRNNNFLLKDSILTESCNFIINHFTNKRDERNNHFYNKTKDKKIDNTIIDNYINRYCNYRLNHFSIEIYEADYSNEDIKKYIERNQINFKKYYTNQLIYIIEELFINKNNYSKNLFFKDPYSNLLFYKSNATQLTELIKESIDNILKYKETEIRNIIIESENILNKYLDLNNFKLLDYNFLDLYKNINKSLNEYIDLFIPLAINSK